MIDSPPPLLYTLPDDLATVQVMAITAALNAAFICASGACECRQKAQGQHLSLKRGGIQMLAIEFARLYLQIDMNGRRGTNNEALFRAIFAHLIGRVYPVFLTFLSETPQALALLVELFRDVPSDAPRRLAYLIQIARHYHGAATTQGTPLVFTWPLLPDRAPRGGV